MTRTRKLSIVLVGLFLLVFGWIFWTTVRGDPPPPPLSVTFVGWTNNPVRSPAPFRLEVAAGATGQCALFWVTNTGPREKRLWFRTVQVERKLDGQWQPFLPLTSSGNGFEGSIWTGGYGCLFAVGWPSGLPTNSTWRLQLRSGRDRSHLRVLLNSRLGRELFRRSETSVILSSSEVTP